MKREAYPEPDDLRAFLWLAAAIPSIGATVMIERAGLLAASNPWVWVAYPVVCVLAALGVFGLYKYEVYRPPERRFGAIPTQEPKMNTRGALSRYLDRRDGRGPRG